jgi:hypothetical protein
MLQNERLSAADLDQMRPWPEQLADYLSAIGRRAGE